MTSEAEMLRRIAQEMRSEHDRGDGHFSTEEVELIERVSRAPLPDTERQAALIREMAEWMENHGCVLRDDPACNLDILLSRAREAGGGDG